MGAHPAGLAGAVSCCVVLHMALLPRSSAGVLPSPASALSHLLQLASSLPDCSQSVNLKGSSFISCVRDEQNEYCRACAV